MAQLVKANRAENIPVLSGRLVLNQKLPLKNKSVVIGQLKNFVSAIRFPYSDCIVLVSETIAVEFKHAFEKPICLASQYHLFTTQV